MAKSSASNPVLAEDPYLALNAHEADRAAEHLTALMERIGAKASLDPAMLAKLTSILDKLQRAVTVLGEAKADRAPLPLPVAPQAWDAEIVERDDDGRATKFRFTAR